jgi:HAMP domain-containing protein
VTKAVAAGDLSKKITVDVKGEILELKATINTMVDQLSSFAPRSRAWRARSAPRAGLGGQAQVRGVSGTWKDLTDNVNFMAGNLTSQVRGIAKVGDGRRQRRPEAQADRWRPRARSPRWPTRSTA